MHDRDEIFQIFLGETDDLLKIAEDSLLRLEAGTEPKSAVAELFRAIHTLKSGSAMVGLANLASYVHLLENLLDQVRNDRLPVTEALVSLLLQEVDSIRGMVAQSSSIGQDADPMVIDAVRNRLQAFLGTAPGSKAEGPEKTGCCRNEVEIVAGEVSLPAGQVMDVERLPTLAPQENPDGIPPDESKTAATPVHKPPAMQKKDQVVDRQNSIRVGVEKIDRLLNLAEEIGISIARIQDLFSRPATPCLSAIEGELHNLSKTNQELQERINHVRMFPLEEAFNRFRRLARDTACDQRKLVKITVTGGDVELDKEVIEAITDPLKHLVRNCIDHGLELPEERLAAGKTTEGTIDFRAFRRGGRIHIQISDDGRGFDLEAIRRQALNRGLARPGEDFDGDTLMRCVCSPGFSTATEVTETSGRGVGMDVVKNQVEQLGGELRIDTTRGKGTTFTLTLPVTLTLTEVLHVQEQGISFLVPLLGVIGTEGYETQRSISFGPRGQVYWFRGEYLPLVQASSLFGQTAAAVAGNQPGMAVVVIDTGSKKIAIRVDEVLEPCQVVVKSLETTFRNIDGIAGATIMGDGSISLVLDLHGFEDFFSNSYGQGVWDENRKLAGKI